jgi:ribonuclease VapC
MVLDTSAIVAILSNELERERFIRLIETAPIRRLSAANRVEATLVIEGRKRDAGRVDLDLFLSEADVEIVPVTLEQAELACQAFRRYGSAATPPASISGTCSPTRSPRAPVSRCSSKATISPKPTSRAPQGDLFDAPGNRAAGM